MRWHDYIERNPGVMLGKPVFRGTRLTVELILQKLGEGVAQADLLKAYPRLRPEHIMAAQAYAADMMASDEMIFTADHR